MIRVLLVDDSLTFRAWLKDVFVDDPEFSIVGEAVTGKGALEQVNALKPDVIVLDQVLPEMSGLEVTHEVMSSNPVAIVMLSANPMAADGGGMSKAIGAGALFFFRKPDGEVDRERWKKDFLRTCRAASKVPLLKRKKGDELLTKRKPARPVKLVAIGASTGGPQTVARILESLPVLKVPIVIVIHADDGLPDQLLQWFSRIAKAPVQIIKQPISIDKAGGQILLAPSGKHVVVKDRELILVDTPPLNFCKPSVDELFLSLCPLKHQVAAILLTGMGRDGAEGLKKIRESGGMTIAQDEASSVIFGMPKAAIELGAAEHVLHLDLIPKTIRSLFESEVTK